MNKYNGLARVLAFALAALLCLGLVIPASAAETGKVISIYSAEDLLELAQACRLDTWSQGKTVMLRQDISLDGVDFFPIPTFGGTFDGCGYTVSGLALYDSVTPAGLFGILQPTATVKNLHVTGSVSPSGKAENVGGIAGENYGTLWHCDFTGTVQGSGNVGGIVGINGLTGGIYGCESYGSVKGEQMTGGIAGCNLGIITGCENNAFINTASAGKSFRPEDIDLTFDLTKLSSLDTSTAATDTGGIAGYSSGIIGACTNSGIVGYPHVGYNVGGIVGRSCGYLTGCENTALVYGRKDVGGITGQMEPYIAASISVSTLDQLQQQLEELDLLINQALENAGSGMDAVTARLNGMAGCVGSASAGLKDIETTASITGSITAGTEGAGSGSITVTPPRVEVGAGIGKDDNGIGGGFSGGLTEGGISGEGSSSLEGGISSDAQITMNTSLNGLASSLYGLAGQMQALSGDMAGITGSLKTDITAIREKVDAISDTAYELLQGEGSQDILVDSSETDIDLITLGKIADCENSGDIHGDINIGGIGGSMALEYELDPEDDLSAQVDGSQQRRYEAKAVVQRCVNTGTVTAKRSYAGGIAGRMDLGLIVRSENYGFIRSESGDYVGGIAGVTSSTVRGCFVKCTLSGGSYIGGIVGSGVGKDLSGGYSYVVSCCSMVEIAEYEQFAGAIAGDRAGSFLDNCFVSDTLSGINGRSFSGEAEPIGYEELLNRFLTEPEETEAMEETESQEETEPVQTPVRFPLPEEFYRFSLKFVIEGETVKEQTFCYGDSFDSSVYPEIPEKDGCYAYWDQDSLENLKFDTVVTAVYAPYTTALASRDKRENGRAVFYTQGDFDGDAVLTAESLNAIPVDLDVVVTDPEEVVKRCLSGGYLYRKVQECWHLTIPEDGLTEHTVRFLPPEGKRERLAVFLKEDGQWREVDAEFIGSYLTFETEGSQVEMALLSTLPVWWIWLIPAALAAAALWLLIRLALRRYRKYKSSLPETPDQGNTPQPPANPGKKKILLIVLAVVLALALIAAGCAVAHWMHPGMQALSLLREYAGRRELAMNLTVDAAFGDQRFTLEADMDRTRLDGKDVTVIRQGNNALYYCADTVYLDNGNGYQLNAEIPDYSQVLDRVLELCRRVDITSQNGEYAMTVSGTDAASLLEILIPTLAEQIPDLDSLEVRLIAENGTLQQVRFQARGNLEGKNFSLNAALDFPEDREILIPHPVRSAIAEGTGEITTVMSADLMALVSAWNDLDSRTMLCADLSLNADCGPLKIQEDLEFYRDTTGKQVIYSLQKNGYGLYFTDGRICDRRGLSVSAEQAQLADAAQLLDLAWELFRSADVTISDGVYTVSLDEDGMNRVALAIAPQSGEMDTAYGEGTAQLRLSGGEIESICFRVSGSVNVVLVEVPVSLEGKLTIPKTQREWEIPEAVRSALEP